MTIENLITDDSFISYCFNKKQEDVEYWESYLKCCNPGDLELVTEATLFVLSLGDILQHVEYTEIQKKAGLYAVPLTKTKPEYVLKRSERKRKMYQYFAIAGIFFLIAIGIYYFLNGNSGSNAKKSELSKIVNTREKENISGLQPYVSTYKTGVGEQKTFWLSDNTKIILNSSSILTIKKGFGSLERAVLLEGEALFDVTHNDHNIPFTVETSSFTIKVLGTKFNVTSYSSDNNSEASLLRGKIELVTRLFPSKKFVLSPLQKVIVDKKGTVNASMVSGKYINKINEIKKVLNEKVNIEEALSETAWVYNRMEIIDERFEDFAATLERRYDVKISFTDNIVKEYKYTAVFEKESIDEVLQALAGSLPFNYEKKGNNILIKK